MLSGAQLWRKVTCCWLLICLCVVLTVLTRDPPCNEKELVLGQCCLLSWICAAALTPGGRSVWLDAHSELHTLAEAAVGVPRGWYPGVQDPDHWFTDSRAQNQLWAWVTVGLLVQRCESHYQSSLSSLISEASSKKVSDVSFSLQCATLFFHLEKMPLLSVMWRWTVLWANNVICQWAQWVVPRAVLDGKAPPHAHLSPWDPWKTSYPVNPATSNRLNSGSWGKKTLFSVKYLLGNSLLEHHYYKGVEWWSQTSQVYCDQIIILSLG